MNIEDLKQLRTGDVVRHKHDADGVFIVMANFGRRVSACRIADITNPEEWELVERSESQLAAEVNRRCGEMSVLREALSEVGVPCEIEGITLTLSQRVRWLVDSIK